MDNIHRLNKLLQKVEDDRRRDSTFFELSHDLLCVANPDTGMFIKLSPSWHDALGWTLYELLSKPWISFVHPEDKEATEGARENLVHGQKVVQFRNRYLTKGGSYVILEWTSSVDHKNGLVYGVARVVG